ncbi:beta-ketoacyl-ACP synthase III [Desulfobaculum bizertense]|uniref:Beta-ketoacyl-[acyl-carrier-protein] synthase III n=1 Tax=Desulfobaculum bizertense DSM 18034 TaxID=1121442 RepID=A0A1T4VEF7_9BACT|nr:beta-ketoacyl-ACP synthase III [Desulfobaculum bizertense]SKA63307.1 3-oxoacyl-[acyl-carrier-protein] synthase III [Desulfobaculum bizertense DSM 18034]
MTTKAYIRGLGYHVPEKIVTNTDLEKIVETSDEWISTRTGIRQRHVAAEGEATSDLAAGASRKALDAAGISAKELTHIFCATCTPDEACPSASTRLQHKIDAAQCMSVDMNAACSGFLYALETARGMIALHPQSKVLVSAAEVMTSRINWEDRTTCVLFGDGAGAAVVSGEKGDDGIELVDSIVEADGQHGDLLVMPAGGSKIPYRLGDVISEEHFLHMTGREVFKVAVRSMVDVCKRILAQNDLTVDDIDWLVPHQANSRIIEAVGKKLQVPTEKVFVNVDRFGNTSAASIAIALGEGVESGDFKPGQTVLLTTFGGGFTWAAYLLRF